MAARQSPTFATLLRQYRVAAGLTQEELAERARVSTRTVSDLERGLTSRPYRDTIRRLSAALELPGVARLRFEAAARGTNVLEPGSGAPSHLDRYPNNLPNELTSFVARESESRKLRDLLTGAEVRLLTLLGAGGTGKTRLALRVGRDLLEAFPDGVFLVSLAPIDDPELVLPTIATVLGVKETGERAPRDALADHLQDKQLLLILDNFERLVEAGPAVKRLLEGAADLRILITSRAPLHLYGEHQFPVSPLAFPDLDHLPPLEELPSYGAIALFIDRARAVLPDFALTADNGAAIAAICSRLDGLPLAIELATPQIHLLSPEALLARLSSRLETFTGGASDVPARQQTLRATIDWSFDLLTDDEKALFVRLSVFAGSCGVEAIEAVCGGDGGQKFDALDRVKPLVERGVLRQVEGVDGEPRVAMLETIREYAAEQLELSGESERLRQRRADYFVGLTERLGSKLGDTDTEMGTGLARLEQDRDNLRATLRWLLDTGDGLRALHMATLLGAHWATVSSYSEGQSWLEEALAMTPAAPPLERAWAYSWASWLATLRGAFEQGRALGEEGLHQFRQADNRDIPTGFVLSAIQLGELVSIQTFLESDLAECRELGDSHGVAGCLHWLGEVALDRGQFKRAIALSEESIRLARTEGDRWLLMHTLDTCARARLLIGDVEPARQSWEEGLRLAMERPDRRRIAFYLEGFAAVAARENQIGRCGRLYGAATSLREEINSPLSAPEAAILQRMLKPVRGQGNSDVFQQASEEGRLMGLEAAVACALEDRVQHPDGSHHRRHWGRQP